MAQIFPSTALRTNQSEVKRVARQGETVITDSKGKNFIFCSEDVFNDALQRAADEAAYAERMARGIRRARAGIAQGAYVVGADAAIAAAKQLQHSRG